VRPRIRPRVSPAGQKLTKNRYAVRSLLNVFCLVIGLFLHAAAAIILVGPIVILMMETYLPAIPMNLVELFYR
jgi:TRAP-type C4-dicarboxylate transport system permease large subunit